MRFADEMNSDVQMSLTGHMDPFPDRPNGATPGSA